jgi:hypothetical protein
VLSVYVRREGAAAMAAADARWQHDALAQCAAAQQHASCFKDEVDKSVHEMCVRGSWNET